MENSNGMTEPQCSPIHAKENNKLQHWKTSYRNGSESNLEHCQNEKLDPKVPKNCSRRLNTYKQKMTKHHAEKATSDTKRKRTRDDDFASRDIKLHHRDSSFGSNDCDANSNVSQDSPRRNKFQRKPVKIEYDKDILLRRQKQIDYGKNTIGYDRYCSLVPKDKRQRNDPSTPPKHHKYSRRAWDGLVKKWRQKLHSWDPPQNRDMSGDSKDSPNGDQDEEKGSTSDEEKGSTSDEEKGSTSDEEKKSSCEDEEKEGSSKDEEEKGSSGDKEKKCSTDEKKDFMEIEGPRDWYDDWFGEQSGTEDEEKIASSVDGMKKELCIERGD